MRAENFYTAFSVDCFVMFSIQLLFTLKALPARQLILMEKEFATIGGIDEVAKRLHISSEHLSRSFHSEWGIAPVQYLNKMRIQSAMNDLLGSTDTIEVIAVKNGFANGNYFS